MALNDLNAEERLLLMRLVCAFAWVDSVLTETEKAFALRLMERLELDEQQCAQAHAWLARPMATSDLDIQKVPARHREVFLDAVMGMVEADGYFSDAELVALNEFEHALTL